MPENEPHVDMGDNRHPRHRPSGQAAGRLERCDRRPGGDDSGGGEHDVDENEHGVHDSS